MVVEVSMLSPTRACVFQGLHNDARLQKFNIRASISVAALSQATARAHSQQHTMIQRSVLRQIRASSSRLQIHPVSSASRPFFPAAQIPALSSRQQLYRRCYSTTAEANASTEGETSATEEVPTEVKEEDPVKQELEAKKAEVINLKVRPPPPSSPHHPQHPPLKPPY